MKKETILEVSASEFYQQLLQSAKYDIEQVTNKKITLLDVEKGFSYKKKLRNKIGKEDLAVIRSVSLVKDVCYEIEVKGTQGTNHMRYSIERLGENRIKVAYEEEFLSQSKLKSANHKIMTLFYNYSAKQRMGKLFNQIESYIISNREGNLNS